MLDGTLELERLDQLDDDTVIAELVAVKGLGEWSAHMYLMFQLGRPDVLAPGDLGIRRAIMLAYGLDEMPPPRGGRPDRRAVAAVPDDRMPVPVALDRGRAAIAVTSWAPRAPT